MLSPFNSSLALGGHRFFRETQRLSKIFSAFRTISFRSSL